MIKAIQSYILRTLVFTIISVIVATLIWYFTGATTLQRLSTILFWTGTALLVVSVLMFAGGNKSPSSGKTFTGSNIGMSFGKQLDMEDALNRPVQTKIETTLLQIALVGGLLLLFSWIIAKWFI